MSLENKKNNKSQIMIIKILKPQSYSAIGQKPNQEDSLFPLLGVATENTRVFLVCDGMGGHENGEVASACVAETIGKITSSCPPCSTVEMKDTFEKALQQAYSNLDNLDKSASERKMGTTLTFLAICTDGVLVAHIGDSRVYQLRPDKGVVFQTRDHSLVNDLIAAGELTEEEARTFPQRNVITRAIQPHQEYPAKAAFNILTDVKKGDLFFLCCDGVLEQLDNNDLATCLLNGKPLEERIATIEKECKERATRDNNTAYLIEVSGVEEMENEKADEVRLETVESKTLTSDITAKPKKGKKHHFLIMLFAVVAVVACALIFMFSSGDAYMEKKHDVPQKEQLQGTIQRHNK